MLARLLRLLPAGIPNRLIRWRGRVSGRTPLAHHGLQRSGTNHLNVCLARLGARPLNAFDPARDHPSHKHFRWQADKSTIAPAYRHQYGNDARADDVETLDRRAGFPPGCRHLVIVKPLEPWLASMCNWGLGCGWFDSKDQALAALPDLAADHAAFHAFWERLAASRPERVAILDSAELQTGLECLTKALTQLGVGFDVPAGFDGRVREVPMSPSRRAQLVSVDEVRNARASRERR